MDHAKSTPSHVPQGRLRLTEKPISRLDVKRFQALSVGIGLGRLTPARPMTREYAHTSSQEGPAIPVAAVAQSVSQAGAISQILDKPLSIPGDRKQQTPTPQRLQRQASSRQESAEGAPTGGQRRESTIAFVMNGIFAYGVDLAIISLSIALSAMIASVLLSVYSGQTEKPWALLVGWTTELKPVEWILTASVLLAAYFYLFRWVAGATPGRMLLGHTSKSALSK